MKIFSFIKLASFSFAKNTSILENDKMMTNRAELILQNIFLFIWISLITIVLSFFYKSLDFYGLALIVANAIGFYFFVPEKYFKIDTETFKVYKKLNRKKRIFYAFISFFLFSTTLALFCVLMVYFFG